MQQPLNPRYSLSRIDLQGDSLQKSFVGLPTMFSSSDSRQYVDDVLSSPAPATQDDPDILAQINKKLGELIGFKGDALTSGPSEFFRDAVVASVGLLVLGIGLYTLTK